MFVCSHLRAKPCHDVMSCTHAAGSARASDGCHMAISPPVLYGIYEPARNDRMGRGLVTVAPGGQIEAWKVKFATTAVNGEIFGKKNKNANIIISQVT